ncbi:Rv3235 family protein [Phytohabitans sp. ZYX-F-186]|uniref:Rv3235 family protein n=1 Tax=Phytohabitans maris TaxID=3071409 RepID=A0ABU0ZEK0_9ACTN|nr:Rv3235 family protein [Phytohabitans sp. ZYX-F-186]MDQ7904854.1 Rv3235 family protein [Phytohabitans sp. ZYX-F-186]
MIAQVRPAIRLRPAPALDPPFDDETAPQLWDQLPLQLDGATRHRRHAPIPVPRVRSGAPTLMSPESDGDATAQPTLADASEEAKRAARRFLDVCLEIFNGYRPIAHIRGLTGYNASPIVDQMAACLDRANGLRRAHDPGRVLPRERRSVFLRHLRVCEPRAGVAEGAAALALFGRTWALAFRLERKRGRWHCAAVRLV